MQGCRFGLFVFCVLIMGVSVAHAKFLQTDPLGYQDQMNLYAYVHNDPINSTDPTGMQTAQELRYTQAVRQWSSGELTDKELWALSNGPCAGTCNVTEVVLTATTMSMIVSGGVGCLAGGREALIAVGPALGVAAEISNLSSGDPMPSVGNVGSLFRAVDGAELTSITKSGKFTLGPNGAEVKAFVDNYDDASALAQQYTKTLGEPYSVVTGQAPKSVINNAERYNFTDVPGKPMEAIAVRDPQQLQQICNLEVC